MSSWWDGGVVSPGLQTLRLRRRRRAGQSGDRLAGDRLAGAEARMGPEDLRHPVISAEVAAPEGDRGADVVAGRRHQPDPEPVGFLLGPPHLLGVAADRAEQALLRD